MTPLPWSEPGTAMTLDAAQWQAILENLYERDDLLGVREPGGTYRTDEAVDAYALSAYAEALRSGEVDGDMWGTLEDIDETATTEDEAWAKITAFYLDRGGVLVRVTGMDEPEEWIFAADVAARLGLPAQGA